MHLSVVISDDSIKVKMVINLWKIRVYNVQVITGEMKYLLGWQLSDCGFCQYQLMIKSAIT